MDHKTPIQIKRCRIRALNSKFRIGDAAGGHAAVPGEEIVVDRSDGEMLERTGKAMIVGEEPDRVISGKDITTDYPRNWRRA
jgi:hypothetical protein